MRVINPPSTPRTFQAIKDGRLHIARPYLKKLFRVSIQLDQNECMENIREIYDTIDEFNTEASMVIVNYLIEQMEYGCEHYKEIYNAFLAIQREKNPDVGRLLFSYTFESQIRFCIREKMFFSMKTILSMLRESEKPNLMSIAIDAGDLDIFNQALILTSPNEATDILQYLPYMNKMEPDIVDLAKQLIEKNIGTRHAMRAASNSLSQKKYKLFELFMNLSTMNVTKWDCFLFREAVYNGEYPAATLCLLHPSMEKKIAESMLSEYKGKSINCNHHESIAISLLDQYLQGNLKYPSSIEVY